MNRQFDTEDRIDQISVFLMHRSIESSTLADQYEKEGFRRDREDQAAEYYSQASMALMRNEIKMAQAYDTISRLAVYAGLENDRDVARVKEYLCSTKSFDSSFRYLRPQKAPLLFRARRWVWCKTISASNILRAYG